MPAAVPRERRAVRRRGRVALERARVHALLGRTEVWEVHRKMAELGGDVRTGLEDTFYLPNGDKATSNGQLIEALATVARESGRQIASPEDTRRIMGIQSS